MNWFLSLELAYQYTIIFLALLLTVLLFGFAKVFYERKIVNRKLRRQKLEVSHPKPCPGLGNFEQKLEEGDLFGIRAIEAGYFGGVAQSNPSSRSNSLKADFAKSLPSSIFESSPLRTSMLSMQTSVISNPSSCKLPPFAKSTLTSSSLLNSGQTCSLTNLPAPSSLRSDQSTIAYQRLSPSDSSNSNTLNSNSSNRLSPPNSQSSLVSRTSSVKSTFSELTIPKTLSRSPPASTLHPPTESMSISSKDSSPYSMTKNYNSSRPESLIAQSGNLITKPLPALSSNSVVFDFSDNFVEPSVRSLEENHLVASSQPNHPSITNAVTSSPSSYHLTNLHAPSPRSMNPETCTLRSSNFSFIDGEERFIRED